MKPTMEELLDLQIPQAIRLSPNSQQVVYSTTLPHGHKTGEHPVSTLWLAETGKPKSSRQLTSGLSNDTAPRWSPDGKSIAFISDRAKAGESSAIYVLSVADGGEAYPVTLAENERAIERFEWSPDGTSIAFISADEKTEERRRREKEKDDAQVWGEEWVYGRLRTVHVATKAVTTLVSREAHVVDLAWCPDGGRVAFTEVHDTEISSPMVHGVTFSIVNTTNKEVKKVCRRGNKVWDLTWSGERLFFIAGMTEYKNGTSLMVYTVDLSSANSDGSASYEKYAHGEEDCAMGLATAGPGEVVVFVQHGMEDQLRILGGHTLFSKKRKIQAWHAAFTTDSDEIVLAIAQSDINHPVEVYTTTASGGAMVPLSQHGHAFTTKQQNQPNLGTTTFLTCRTLDGKYTLECPFFTPSNAPLNPNGTPQHPLPTIVLIHGGPYYRHTESFDALYYMWAPYLLAAGYAILLADYRGSSGRGETWATYGQHVGEHDYADIISQTQAGIENGWIDSTRLAVGGWSQGGYLSYLASVRNGTHGYGWHFRAAIPGAGVSDGDTMCFTSDAEAFEAELAGSAPWRLRKEDVGNRQMSAVWEFATAVQEGRPFPQMLILHGEEDARVPVEQAVGMRRALTSAGVPFECVVYPREPHLFKEKRHLVDMGERVLRFVEKHIGPGVKG